MNTKAQHLGQSASRELVLYTIDLGLISSIPYSPPSQPGVVILECRARRNPCESISGYCPRNKLTNKKCSDSEQSAIKITVWEMAQLRKPKHALGGDFQIEEIRLRIREQSKTVWERAVGFLHELSGLSRSLNAYGLEKAFPNLRISAEQRIEVTEFKLGEMVRSHMSQLSVPTASHPSKPQQYSQPSKNKIPQSSN